MSNLQLNVFRFLLSCIAFGMTFLSGQRRYKFLFPIGCFLAMGVLVSFAVTGI